MRITIASTHSPIINMNKKENVSQKNKRYRYSYSKTSNQLKETTRKAIVHCDPKKKHFTMMSSECVAIWSEVEELIDILDTIQNIEDLNDLDFKI